MKATIEKVAEVLGASQKRVVFLLSRDLISILRKASYERSESMSSIVRRAIQEYLKK